MNKSTMQSEANGNKEQMEPIQYSTRICSGFEQWQQKCWKFKREIILQKAFCLLYSIVYSHRFSFTNFILFFVAMHLNLFHI